MIAWLKSKLPQDNKTFNLIDNDEVVCLNSNELLMFDNNSVRTTTGKICRLSKKQKREFMEWVSDCCLPILSLHKKGEINDLHYNLNSMQKLFFLFDNEPDPVVHMIYITKALFHHNDEITPDNIFKTMFNRNIVDNKLMELSGNNLSYINNRLNRFSK